MVVEREGNFFESRRAGIPFARALRGERAWFELTPGTFIDDRTAIKDGDTIVVHRGGWSGNWRAFGQIWYDEVSGDEINNYKFDFLGISIRWRPGISLEEIQQLYSMSQRLFTQLQDLQDELGDDPSLSNNAHAQLAFRAKADPLLAQAEEFVSMYRSRLGPKLVNKGDVEH